MPNQVQHNPHPVNKTVAVDFDCWNGTSLVQLSLIPRPARLKHELTKLLIEDFGSSSYPSQIYKKEKKMKNLIISLITLVLLSLAINAQNKKTTINPCQRATLVQPEQKAKKKENRVYEPIFTPWEITNDSSQGQGRGQGSGNGSKSKENPPAEVEKAPPLRDVPPNSDIYIISKPRAFYPENAKAKQIQGGVVLRITFLASGKIGKVSVVKGLPEGLTEQAKIAAAKIKFEPARQNCVDVSRTKTIIYSFYMY